MKAYAPALAISFGLLAGGLLPTTQNRASTDGKKSGAYAELAQAPDKARARPNPFANDPDAIAAGRNLFTEHCAECHGDDALGGKRRRNGPSLREPEVQNAEPGAIFWVLTNGVVRRGMPVWSKLPEPQRWQLVSFIRSLGTVSKPSEKRLD